MDLKQANVTIKDFLLDEEFKTSKNPHRYIILWSSKFHRLINKVMRTNDIDKILENTIYARKFIIRMTQYFFKYGITRDELSKRCAYLYRGITKDFQLTTEYIEDGFMSTSQSSQVARTFTGQDNGQIIAFKTSKLPKNTPFVIIDETIHEDLLEQEVLFLPGNIRLRKSSSFIKAYYKMNPAYKSLSKSNNNKETKEQSGSGISDIGFPIKDSDFINLKGKYVIWWRAIKNRPVEVVGTMQLPKKVEDVVRFFNKVVLPHDDLFEAKTNFIPEYQDLKKKHFKDWRAMTKEENELYQSYMVHMAIYNHRQSKVLTIHYGCFAEMFNEELFNPIRTQEVHDAIVKSCEWFSYKPKPPA